MSKRETRLRVATTSSIPKRGSRMHIVVLLPGGKFLNTVLDLTCRVQYVAARLTAMGTCIPFTGTQWLVDLKNSDLKSCDVISKTGSRCGVLSGALSFRIKKNITDKKGLPVPFRLAGRT